MEQPTLIEVDFEHLTRSDYLGDRTSFPYSEELQNALRTVNDACEKRVGRIKRDIKNEFLAKKYNELKQKEGDTKKIMVILNEIADYKD